MLKENADHMLCNEMKTVYPTWANKSVEKQFKSVKSTAIKMINKFFRDTEQQFPRYGLKLVYFRNDLQSPMSGFQIETRPQILLEALDYDSIDKVLSLLGALVDVFCKNKNQ